MAYCPMSYSFSEMDERWMSGAEDFMAEQEVMKAIEQDQAMDEVYAEVDDTPWWLEEGRGDDAEMYSHDMDGYCD